MSDRPRDRIRDHLRADAAAAENPRVAFRQMLPRLIFGAWLVALGVLFTLDNIGVIDADRWIRFWPAMFILLGLGLLASARTRAEIVSGTIWAGIGGMLVLDQLHVIRVDLWDFWPLILVGAGVALVLRGVRPRLSAVGDASSTLHAFAVMSGVTRKSASIAFEGGSLTAVMGGVEADLRSARMVRQQAVLDCFAFWGGIDVKVPPGWTVHSRIWPFMGGFEDKTTPPAPEDASGELVLTGFVCMGGVAVKN